MKNGIYAALGTALAFVTGVAVGLLIKNFPFFVLDKEVSLIEGLNLFVSVGIAFLIPYGVSKIIEDHQGIKLCIIEEINDLIVIIKKIKTIIFDSHRSGSFLPKERDEINYIFHEAELKVHSIEEQLKVAFPAGTFLITEELKKIIFTYNDYLTDGEMMLSSFASVDIYFYKSSNTQYFKAETSLKTLIQKVHRL